jgi:hypothetical protein
LPECKAKTRGENSSEGRKARRGSADGPRVTPARCERISQVHESLIPKSRGNTWLRARGAARGESRGGSWEGEASESHNPKDGFGMKQSRRGTGGKKRQEVEKTWRRSKAGCGKPGVGRCPCLKTSKGKEPREGSFADE